MIQDNLVTNQYWHIMDYDKTKQKKKQNNYDMNSCYELRVKVR